MGIKENPSRSRGTTPFDCLFLCPIVPVIRAGFGTLAANQVAGRSPGQFPHASLDVFSVSGIGPENKKTALLIRSGSIQIRDPVSDFLFRTSDPSTPRHRGVSRPVAGPGTHPGSLLMLPILSTFWDSIESHFCP